jgi:hypothetical protein
MVTWLNNGEMVLINITHLSGNTQGMVDFSTREQYYRSSSARNLLSHIL